MQKPRCSIFLSIIYILFSSFFFFSYPIILPQIQLFAILLHVMRRLCLFWLVELLNYSFHMLRSPPLLLETLARLFMLPEKRQNNLFAIHTQQRRRRRWRLRRWSASPQVTLLVFLRRIFFIKVKEELQDSFLTASSSSFFFYLFLQVQIQSFDLCALSVREWQLSQVVFVPQYCNNYKWYRKKEIDRLLRAPPPLPFLSKK